MTEPSTIEYWLPWHGHWMMPLLTEATVHPMCVHTAVNALKTPAVGWVTTIFCAVRISPPPTGISVVLTVAPEPVAAGLLESEVPAAGEVAAGDPEDPHAAVTAVAAITAAPVISTCLRV